MDLPIFLSAAAVAPRSKPSNYPPVFAARTEGRIKRQLGDTFGLRNFGVNLTELRPGACSGFPAGGPAHHLENRTGSPVRYLDIGDRTEGDTVSYPADDLMALRDDGAWRFCRKDGRPW